MPRVSVAMVTYAHEAYLGQAIESVLAQDLDDWELVIGEDCSPDGTRAVAERYAAAHPDRIRVLDSTENLGGRRNFARVLEALRGDTFCALDGDDYYTAPDRLRTLVELLDARPELEFAFHPVEEVDEGGRPLGRLLGGHRGPLHRRLDMLRYCPTGSAGALHRRPERFDFPDWWWRSPVGDWATHLLLTRTGEAGFVDRVMAAHRNHGEAYWSRLGEAAQLQLRGRCREVLVEAFDEDVSELMREWRFRDRIELGRECERAGDLRAASDAYAWCWRHRRDLPEPFPARRLALRRLRVALRLRLGLHPGRSVLPDVAFDAPDGIGGARATRP